MKINGVELNFNLYSAENADIKKKYYDELSKMQNVSNELPNENEEGDITFLCDRIKGMFNAIFGEGTGKEICGESSDLLKCMDAYEQLVSEQMKQSEKYNSVMSKLKGFKKK